MWGARKILRAPFVVLNPCFYIAAEKRQKKDKNFLICNSLKINACEKR